jgi:capsular exopolysaccharide synthesis family protein
MSIGSVIHTTQSEYLDNGAFPLRSGKTIRLQPSTRSRLVFLTEPTGLAVEQYKLLRRSLNTLQPRGGILLVTSPGPGEGKTLTSVNLAWCLATDRQNTCLVDLDFRAPGVAATLGYTVEDGSAEDVLTGKKSLGESLRQVEDASFYVLGIQKRHASPAEFLSAAVLKPLLNDLRAMFHWVILDLAPAIPMSDVAEVVQYVDGALLVVRDGTTKKAMIASTCKILGSKLWGVVLNDSPIVGSAYYGGYGNDKR